MTERLIVAIVIAWFASGAAWVIGGAVHARLRRTAAQSEEHRRIER
jgi:hypothetical protein